MPFLRACWHIVARTALYVLMKTGNGLGRVGVGLATWAEKQRETFK